MRRFFLRLSSTLLHYQCSWPSWRYTLAKRVQRQDDKIGSLSILTMYGRLLPGAYGESTVSNYFTVQVRSRPKFCKAVL